MIVATKEVLDNLWIIWDYMQLHMQLEKADCIVGFGNFNDNIARRAAQLYFQGYAPKVLFTGGLGRNTQGILPEAEALRFARTAMECGVPESDIIIEDKSTNTAENILFTKELLEKLSVPAHGVLGVHQPFMERRIRAAMGVYWPEIRFQVTSPRTTIEEYLADSVRQGITEKAAIDVIVGDFQRLDIYAKKGYQLPQDIPMDKWDAFHALVNMGYDGQLAK